jgi:hypothetical protein
MKSPRPHFHVVGLKDQASLPIPEVLQTQNEVLKALRRPDEMRHQAFAPSDDCGGK